MPNLGPAELVIIAIVIMLLFGAKRMPDAARALGRSLRIFKAETKRFDEDEDSQRPTAQEQGPSQPQQLPPGQSTANSTGHSTEHSTEHNAAADGRPLDESERTHGSR